MDQSATRQSGMKRHEPILFAWGDVFGGGAQALISVIYLIFLTDVIGIPPAIAGAAILVSKVLGFQCFYMSLEQKSLGIHLIQSQIMTYLVLLKLISLFLIYEAMFLT